MPIGMVRNLVGLVVLVCGMTMAFDVRAFLAEFAPGTLHEARPHGVPTFYDWQSRAIGGTPSRPSPETTHMNLWGQVYVDLSDYHAPNVRVEVKNSQLWILWNSSWELGYRTDNLGGGAWTEDFTRCCGTFDMRTESDGGRSFVPAPGYNAHFWPELPFLPAPTVPRAVIAVAHTRLILENPAGPDNRASSAYIIGMGADWRAPDGSCPNDICTGFGVGRFIRPTSAWRTVVMSTMSVAELASLPMPPEEIFLMPDGRYPDGSTPIAQASRSVTRSARWHATDSELYAVNGTKIGSRATAVRAHTFCAVRPAKTLRAWVILQ